MQSFLTTLGYGLLALLAVSVLVAVVEHLHQQMRDKEPPPPKPPPRAANLNLDVDLDILDPAPAQTDQTRRQAAVGSALALLARGDTASSVQVPWTETKPMVSQGNPSESETL